MVVWKAKPDIMWTRCTCLDEIQENLWRLPVNLFLCSQTGEKVGIKCAITKYVMHVYFTGYIWVNNQGNICSLVKRGLNRTKGIFHNPKHAFRFSTLCKLLSDRNLAASGGTFALIRQFLNKPFVMIQAQRHLSSSDLLSQLLPECMFRN